MSDNRFEQWAILEILGHQRFAGLVTEQTVGGSSFVRIDVPVSDGRPAFTKLFGAGSIYCITPVAEDIARAMARELRKEPMSIYDFPEEIRDRLRSAPAITGTCGDQDDDYDDFADLEG